MSRDLPFYTALAACPGIGPRRFKVLLEYFSTAESVWKASDKALEKVLTANLFNQFIGFRKKFDIERYFSTIVKHNVRVITLKDDDYPALLRQIEDAPPVLYLKGQLPSSGKIIGVVGTRKMTAYGRQVTQILVQKLVEQNFVIVSGLARGVDSCAHRTTLESGGVTVAVLGGGLDIIYPAENVDLAEKITASGGALISEFPLGMKAMPSNFPARNRIISGLSLGVLVTEAGEDSGSLITANLAAEQGREVFAVPGPIYSKLSNGPAWLIKQGAKLVTSIDDILEELNLNKVEKARRVEVCAESDEERIVIDLLKEGPMHIDEIARRSAISLPLLGSLLSLMEVKGKIKLLEQGKYSID